MQSFPSIPKNKRAIKLVMIEKAKLCYTKKLYGHTLIERRSKVSTSPSLFLGMNSLGNLRSNTYSVLGNNPRSLSKKNLKTRKAIILKQCTQ